MNPSYKIPHRAWYFLLCYLAYSSYTFNFIMLEFLRPKLMIMYHLDTVQMTLYYKIIFMGMLAGGIVFSFLVSLINYRTCFITLWVIQILGLIKLLSLSPIIVNTPIIHQLKAGMLLMGIANGGIFAVIHPLIALIFHDPKQSKTKIMNFLHTNWPLFVAITCLFEVILLKYHLDWFWSIYAMLFLSCIYMVVAVFLPLPIQIHAHRIPIRTRLKSMARPGYVLLLFCMICSCVIQYSPSVWIKNWIEIDLKIRPLYFLMFVSGIQITFRLFAGSIAQKISPPGLLGLAAIMSALSLYLLGITTHTSIALCAITVLMMSISCYWPTYIAIVADRYPLSSGLGMGLMNVSAYFALIHLVPEVSTLTDVETPQHAFLDLSWFAAFEFILLIGVYVAFRTQGGYKVLSTYDQSL
ncbi:MAG: MFS transporter [Legionellaceae bacterium]|nr:MFS transporter [Legionellaceae bacterium]MBP9775107.1 MFS transporter [Legionellaceae bacterium]